MSASDEYERVAAYVDSLHRTNGFKTISVSEPFPAKEGDRITINMKDGHTFTGTVQSCEPVDDLNYDLMVIWDKP